MQIRRGVPAVLSRCEKDEVAAGRQLYGWEPPPGEVFGVIAEIPAGEVDGDISLVVEFDPVLEIAILIRQAVIIAGEKFADEYRLGPGRGCQGQDRQEEEDVFEESTH